MFLNMVELKFYVCCRPSVRIQYFTFISFTGICNQLNIYIVTLPVIAFAEHLHWANMVFSLHHGFLNLVICLRWKDRYVRKDYIDSIQFLQCNYKIKMCYLLATYE